MSKILLTFFIFLFCGQEVNAQVRVQGTVTDEATGLPVEAVSVFAVGQSRSTVTNEKGEFVLIVTGLPVRLRFSHISYLAKESEATSVSVKVELKPAQTNLKTVSINPVTASGLLNGAWKLAAGHLDKNYFAKAFYRQIATVNDTVTEIHELFYGLKWGVNRIRGWKAEQSRYAKLDSSKGIPVNNQSYLSFLFTGYLFEFNNATYPNLKSIDRDYQLEIERYIEQPDQDIAVVSCKIPENKRKRSSLFIDAVYYIGVENHKIYKVESTVYNVPYVNTLNKATLKAVATFADRDFVVPVLESLTSQLDIPYKKGNRTNNVSLRSIITTYDKDPLLANQKLNATNEFVVDFEVVKKTGYDLDFWQDNPVVKLTPLEQKFISLMEDKKAFGTMTVNYASTPPSFNPKDPTFKMFCEKVYLHTDKEHYAAGEDIWFKAYLLNAQTNRIMFASNTLYVELISPDSKIIAHQLTRLDFGTGSSDFKLKDSLPFGTYRLRAYSNWMRNFGDNFIFEKNIQIFNQLTAEPVAVKNKATIEQLPAISFSANALTKAVVSFFPEGGSLVEGAASLVAFKAEDADGKGMKVKGIVRNSSGERITVFESNEYGMGTFRILPLAAARYLAVVKDSSNDSITVELPQALLHGFAVEIKQDTSLLHVVISTNTATLDNVQKNAMTIVVKSKGTTYYSSKVSISNPTSQIEIPTKLFPAGVASITLFENSKPLCERLFFIEGNKVNIKLILNKQDFSPREKTILTVKATDKYDQPVKANLSLSVVDADITPVNETDIRSSVLLQSEVRGVIEKPSHYFDEKNPDRSRDLDLLLLTQGWRDYTWRRIADSALRISYALEQGISISGRVRSRFANTGIPDESITMYAPKASGTKLFSARTDPTGRFKIDSVMLYGYQFANFTSRRDNRKTGGWIQVDSIFTDVPAVKPLRYATANFVTAPAMKFFAERGASQAKLSVRDTIQLKEVEITDQKLIRKEVFSITSKDHKEYNSLVHYLLNKIPGLDVRYQTPSFYLTYGRGICGVWGSYSDGSQLKVFKTQRINQSEILSIGLPNILKVSVSYYNTILGVVPDVQLLLRPGSLDTGHALDNTMADIVGYYQARTFYAPKYETPSARPDLRTTIHWEPSISTNEKGEAIVSWYNADPKTKVRIIAEGITATGQPVVGTAVYEVK